MYLTHSFVAIKKGTLDYLLFYITEDYVEAQVKLTEQLNPLLEDLGRNLLDKGAVVKAFDRDISDANRELAEKFDQEFTRDIIISINNRMEKPGLLILNSDIQSFNPKEHKWLFISLRSFLEDWGALKVFKMKEFFDILTEAINNGEDLFEEARNYIKMQKAISAHKMIELKPGIFGISWDLKETFNFFKELRK
ncbi:MAG: hypothetical protein DRH50_07730 [Deltaproteobacteria bacterium]|nr:MAG: hypothetical protein DRH50_07730 [Deltaproteobacteria bacterium]